MKCILLIASLFCVLSATLLASAPATTRPGSRVVPPIKPTSGTPESPLPRAVCTFESIGLYWAPPGGAENRICQVHYRVNGQQPWHEALPLWFDKRNGE